MSSPPDLSIVIVSHGHEAQLPPCVASLAGALDGLSAEILVIDNLQAGGAAAALAGLPARVVANRTQVGFAANVNRGAAETTGRWLLFLNPDTTHRAGRIADALGFLDARPDIGLLSCALFDEDGTPQQNYRRFPSPAFLLARGLGADRWPWRPGWYERGLMAGEGGTAPFPVDWVFGAFLLMRRRDFERLGGMDEGYRLYYEDVDLAWRLRRDGLSTWIFPPLSFLHEHQRASAKRPFSRVWRWHVRSALRYFLLTSARRFLPTRRRD